MNLFDLFRRMMQAGQKQTTFAERYGSTLNPGQWPISIMQGDFIAVTPITDDTSFCPAHLSGFMFPAQHVGFKNGSKVFRCSRCEQLFTEEEAGRT